MQERRDVTDYLTSRVAVEKRVRFHEDFWSVNASATPGAGAMLVYSYPWFITGAHPAFGTSADTNGIINLAGDGANTPSMVLAITGTGTTSAPFLASKKPIIKLGFAQFGAAAGTRRIGLAQTALASDTDGIYIRFTVGGNMILVTRASGVETTVDTGVAAANGVFHNLVIAATPTRVDVYVDEAPKGGSTTNIPASIMTASAGNSVTTASNGLQIDYVTVEQDR